MFLHLRMDNKLPYDKIIILSTKAYIRNHDDVMKWKLFPRYWPFVRTMSFQISTIDIRIQYFVDNYVFEGIQKCADYILISTVVCH